MPTSTIEKIAMITAQIAEADRAGNWKYAAELRKQLHELRQKRIADKKEV